MSNDLKLPPPNTFGLPNKFAQWRPHQDTAVESIVNSNKRFIMMVQPTGCHAKGTGILMIDGTTKLVEDIELGDLVIGPDSSQRAVLKLHRGRQEMACVIPNRGGSPFIVNMDHILHLVATGGTGYYKPVCDISVRDYLSKSRTFKHVYKLERVAANFITGWRRISDMPIDPYFLGVLLGGGGMTHGSPNVTTMDVEVVGEILLQSEKWGLHVAVRPKRGETNRAMTYHMSVGRGLGATPNPLKRTLLNLGVAKKCGYKSVPQVYKSALRRERLEVLAGLLDTDGSMQSNCFDFVSKSEKLAADVVFLARSVGLSATEFPHIVYGGRYHRVTISGDTNIIPVRISRKKALPRRQKKDVALSGFSVIPLDEDDYYGFEVSGDKLYLTADFTVHHNSGKSLCYMAASLLNGGRTLILTSTKGLQDQLMDDFGDMSLNVEVIKGKNAYKCPVSHVTANYGPCLLGKSCLLKSKGCPFYDQLKKAKLADVVITNYAFWLSNEEDVLGDFDMLVLDEAHASVQHLLDGMAVQLLKRESDAFIPWVMKDNPDDCLKWGLDLCNMVEDMLKGVHLVAGDVVHENERMLMDLLKKLRQLKLMRRGNMAVEKSSKSITFDPVWPAGMAEPYLFRGIDKVVFTSATVTHKTADLLGMPKDELDYKEYPSSFPLYRRPIYYVPTVRVDHRIKNDGMRLWITRIDQIVGTRKEHKGIIHTVSYDRKNRVLNASEYWEIMVAHDSRNTLKVVERFKGMDPPAILLSPSMVTGWDFPYDQCRWQIVGKVPFPDSRSKVMMARQEKDPTYAYYLTMQALVQAAGRGMRAADDYCETIVIDDHFQWFNYKYRHFAPQAFREAVQMTRTIPARMME